MEFIEQFKRISLKQHINKTALNVASMLFVAFGVVIFIKCELGADPITVFYDGMVRCFGISLGTAANIYSISMLILGFIFAGKYIGVGTALAAIFQGSFIAMGENALHFLSLDNTSFTLKFAMLVLGELMLCFGMALSIAANYGISPSFALVYKISDSTGKQFKLVKTIFDVGMVAVGFLLGGIVGVGTIFSMLITGIFIAKFSAYMANVNSTGKSRNK